MLPGLEMIATCPDLAVPARNMQHVAAVESSHNPYAIGVVGGRLVRQPRNLPEAVSTAQMLEAQGHNFSVGLVQLNRYNLAREGLADYATAFQVCPNVQAGARILAQCHARAGQDWGKAFSCYYSGNFTTGYQHGYVQKVFASLASDGQALAEAGLDRRTHAAVVAAGGESARLARRLALAASAPERTDASVVVQRQSTVPQRQMALAPQPALPPPQADDIAQPLQVSVRGVPVASAPLAAAPAATPPSASPSISPQAIGQSLASGPTAPVRDSALVF